MKNNVTDQNYVILEQTESLSKITGRPCVKIVLVGAGDRKQYTTYIDSNNHNHKQWQHITGNPTHGFVLRNLRVKVHKDKLLVDADSRPIIAAEDETPDRILDTLKDVWLEQDSKKQDLHRRLFE